MNRQDSVDNNAENKEEDEERTRRRSEAGKDAPVARSACVDASFQPALPETLPDVLCQMLSKHRSYMTEMASDYLQLEQLTQMIAAREHKVKLEEQRVMQQMQAVAQQERIVVAAAEDVARRQLQVHRAHEQVQALASMHGDASVHNTSTAATGSDANALAGIRPPLPQGLQGKAILKQLSRLLGAPGVRPIFKQHQQALSEPGRASGSFAASYHGGKIAGISHSGEIVLNFAGTDAADNAAVGTKRHADFNQLDSQRRQPERPALAQHDSATGNDNSPKSTSQHMSLSCDEPPTEERANQSFMPAPNSLQAAHACPVTYSRLLDYKSFTSSLCLTNDMEAHIMPPRAAVIAQKNSQVDVNVVDEAGYVWVMKYRVTDRNAYELRGGWTKFFQHWRPAFGDQVTLTRETPDRFTFKIAVSSPASPTAKMSALLDVAQLAQANEHGHDGN